MSVDLSQTIAAKSDQLNADDLIGGPITGRVLSVREGSSAEQPISIDLDCWPQPYKPCKTMRRVLVDVWGGKGAEYVGRSMRLFRNPDVKFGGAKVGGIEISHVSHIDRPREISLAVSRGKKKLFVIQPLAPTANPIRDRFSAIKSQWKASHSSATADDFRRLLVSTASVAAADAMTPEKYTPEQIAMCEAALSSKRTDTKSEAVIEADAEPQMGYAATSFERRIELAASDNDRAQLSLEIAESFADGRLTQEEADTLTARLKQLNEIPY